jgi:2'-5' RNA ligase
MRRRLERVSLITLGSAEKKLGYRMIKKRQLTDSGDKLLTLSRKKAIHKAKQRIFDNIWAKFQEMNTINKHRMGQSFDLLLMVKINSPYIIKRITKIQEHLEKNCAFDPISTDALHISIRGFNATRKIDYETFKNRVDIERNITKYIECIIGEYCSFKLKLGSLNSFNFGPFIEVYDYGILNSIGKKVDSELSEFVEEDNHSDDDVQHITLGYYHPLCNLDSIKKILEEKRTHKYGKIDVKKISLVKTCWENDFYHFRKIAEFTLNRGDKLNPCVTK